MFRFYVYSMAISYKEEKIYSQVLPWIYTDVAITKHIWQLKDDQIDIILESHLILMYFPLKNFWNEFVGF